MIAPRSVVATLWIVFVVSWLLAAFWSDRPEKRAGNQAEASYLILLLIGAVLLFVPAHGFRSWMRLWSSDFRLVWLCILLIALGFAFAWWARIHLGRLWSAQVTKKQDHRVIDTGPYALVRHPIYTGLILAVFATAAVKGTLPGIAGAVAIMSGLWMKAQLEERFLREELGASYDDYSRRVPMLIPFIGRA